MTGSGLPREWRRALEEGRFSSPAPSFIAVDPRMVTIATLVMKVKMPSAPEEDVSWTVALAKARLAEVIERAQSAPQTIRRNGKPSVVVSAEEWQRKAERKGTLAELLLASPLRGSDLDLERQRDEPRDLSP